MSPDKVNGTQSMDDPDFHQYMRKLYREQHKVETLGVDVNQYHVQAKLPASLYREFHALLKEKGWSITTGIQYAVHKLSQQKQKQS